MAVRRAETGEDVILTRPRAPSVRLVPVGSAKTPLERRAAIDAIMADGRRRRLVMGLSAKETHDELYGENGLPA